MKLFLNLIIGIIIFIIAVDIELNAVAKEVDYSTTFLMIVLLAIVGYGRLYTEELLSSDKS